MKNLSLKLIDLYRLILSPFMGYRCRYTPTCSQYTRQAIVKFGFFKGCYLGFWRILSCNPWGGCGEHPVLDKFSWKPFAKLSNSGKTQALKK